MLNVLLNPKHKMIEYKLKKLKNNELIVEFYSDNKIIKKSVYLFDDLQNKTEKELILLVKLKKYIHIKSEEIFM